MENFRLLFNNNLAIIEQIKQEFWVSVIKNRKLNQEDKGAIIEATHYKEYCVFINEGSYYFEVVDQDYKSVEGEVDLTLFHNSIDFFFKSILDTEYFVKSIPECSSLYKGVKKIVWV